MPRHRQLQAEKASERETKMKKTREYRRAYYEKTNKARALKQYPEQTEPEMHAPERTVTITEDSLDNCRERVHHLLGIQNLDSQD